MTSLQAKDIASNTPGLSVVICSFNGATRLPDTLRHLQCQEIPDDLPWEVVVVDNASTDDTAQVARACWTGAHPTELRVVAEPEPGLGYARKCGIREARYELISFVDDDNWLASDWVARVHEIMCEHPEVGACGGRTTAVPETIAPQWFEQYAHNYVIGCQGNKVGDITWSRGNLWGAGLTLRRSAWNELVERGFAHILSGRKGGKLSSGEDYELCYALRLAGWRLWYCDKLLLRHFIPANRLTLDYIQKLHFGFGAQTIGFDPYHFYVSRQDCQFKSVFWLRQLLREVYIAVFNDRSFWSIFYGKDIRSLQQLLLWQYHRGRISALWGAKSDYDLLVKTFHKNKWINLEHQSSIFLNSNPDFGDAGNMAVSQSPLVSAIICNYNYGHFLADAINSALAQTWPHIEVIVVDDGSTDNSREILQHYTDKIRVILKENGGQASAFNAGVVSATGEILCFLDSDDIWHADKVEQVVKKYREAEWGLVCHYFDSIDTKGMPLGKDHPQMPAPRLRSGDIFGYQQTHGYPWVFSPSSGISMPTEIARKFFPIPEAEFRISADIALVYGAICHAPVGVIDKVLFKYRIHGDNGFASLYRDKSRIHVTNMVDHAKKYFYMRDVAKKLGRSLSSQLNDNYYFYKSAVFTAKKSPWLYLPRLWKRNIKYHFNLRHELKKPLIKIIYYLLDDTALALLMILRIPNTFDEKRKLFANTLIKISEPSRSYLIADN